MLLPAATVVACYFLMVRPVINRWGASDEEVAAVLPGDGIVIAPQSSSTKAITVIAPTVRVLDRIPLAPGPPFYGFTVADVAAPERLVLEMGIHPFTGQQADSAPPGGPWLHASWAFALVPIDERSTRLITRARYRVRMPFGPGLPYRVVLELVEFIMERRMLLGIRERAEAPMPSASLGAS